MKCPCISLAVVFLNILAMSCSNPRPSLTYKYQHFCSEEKAIVQTTGKFFINDIAKGEVNK